MKQIVMLDGVQVAKDAFLQAEDVYYAQVLCNDGDDYDYELYYDKLCRSHHRHYHHLHHYPYHNYSLSLSIPSSMYIYIAQVFQCFTTRGT